MSGQSNVVYWLEKHNLPQEPSVIEAVLKKAKASEKILTEEEILEVVKQNIPSGNAL
jgi:2-isopropylmalate synthase